MPQTPEHATPAIDATKINRAIAELVLKLRKETLEARTYIPMSHAGDALGLVEQFKLDCAYASLDGSGREYWAVWQARRGQSNQVHHRDLKTAICLSVLKLHDIDPETL